MRFGPGGRSSALGGQGFLHAGEKTRESCFDHVRQNIQIEMAVRMREDLAEGLRPPPIHTRDRGKYLRCHALRQLTDLLDALGDRVDGLLIANPVRALIASVPERQPRTFSDRLQQIPIALIRRAPLHRWLPPRGPRDGRTWHSRRPRRARTLAPVPPGPGSHRPPRAGHRAWARSGHPRPTLARSPRGPRTRTRRSGPARAAWPALRSRGATASQGTRGGGRAEREVRHAATPVAGSGPPNLSGRSFGSAGPGSYLTSPPTRGIRRAGTARSLERRGGLH